MAKVTYKYTCALVCRAFLYGWFVSEEADFKTHAMQKIQPDVFDVTQYEKLKLCPM